MIPIKVSRRAFNDLSEIWNYVAADSLTAADRQQQALISSMQRLSDQSFLGRVRPEFGIDARALVAGEYLVIYKVETDHICISRVIHGARDVPHALNKRPDDQE